MKKYYLGIELGSTRIKSVAIDTEELAPASGGSFSWKSELRDGIWSYDLSDAWRGLKKALSEVQDRDNIACMGISGMMHGYLAFDENWNLLVPFRTWQNTITARASAELTQLFNFNIPQRWTSAHLYEAILNHEEHIPNVAHLTTLAGYIHYKLTGVNAVGIDEASAIFPIDPQTLDYDEEMLAKYDDLLSSHSFGKKARDIFPKVLAAGEKAGVLTEEGAKLLDGLLKPGIPFAPPEGDAATGMVATNSVACNTGSLSAGTSIFALIVLDKPLKNFHKEIEIINTPDGKQVAMVHCINCTGEMNALVSVLKEALVLFGADVSDNELFTKLCLESLKGDGDCDGVMVCNYHTDEKITGIKGGLPLILRRPNSRFTLSNLMRSEIYSSMSTISIGIELLKSENIDISHLVCHGGLFKTEGVAQRYMAAACQTNISCLSTSGEGGPYGMALLAAYTSEKDNFANLEDFLNNRAFAKAVYNTLAPTDDDVEQFKKYMENYKKLLSVEAKAVESFT